jgi:hypothetical protein
VERLLDGSVGQQPPQGYEIADRQGVDDLRVGLASWMRKMRSRYRWKLAASVSTATSGSVARAAIASATASGVRR